MVDQEIIHNLCLSDDQKERIKSLERIKYFFPFMPDKHKTWNDLHGLTNDESSLIRSLAADVLGSALSDIPNKQLAWNDLIRLTKDESSSVRSSAADALVSAFPHAPDKQQAWNGLISLTNDESSLVRSRSASALSSLFSQVPDKQLAWNDLIRLTKDESSLVKSWATDALGSNFSHVPDKQQAWIDLHRLTDHEDSIVRSWAALALGSTFPHVPDKQQAWNDLIRLTKDENIIVRSRAAYALGSAFPHVPDKQQAWNDLIRLTKDKDSIVKSRASSALGSAFSQVPDKQKAWNDLHRLTNHEDSIVKTWTAYALGSAFSHVPDKQQAWNDLIRLTEDESINVIKSSNHSLGRISIYKASQANTEEEYKKELEIAICFFEKSAKESFYKSNPSKFCLPFYRSFHTVIFNKQEAKEEMDKYLKEAKDAIEGSESKKQLFEAIKNLSEALKEVQNLGYLDLHEMKGELNFYRKYCDHAAELMRDTNEKTPFATEILRKGLPILNRNLKGILEEIQEKAKAACQVSQGTATQEIACTINKEVQKWEIGTPEEMTLYIENFISTLELKIPRFPENEPIFEMINESKNKKDLKKLLENTSNLIEIIPKITIDPERMKPTIGIIAALPIEYAAFNVLLEHKNEKYKIPGSGAGRRCCLGEILTEEGNKHNIVLAIAGMGNNIAATRASILLENFPNIRSLIMVGIAGGVPNPKKSEDHVRLGDIVVSNENGVIQYDFIKQEIHEIKNRNPPRPPSASLLEAVKFLAAEEILGRRPWEKYIDKALFEINTTRPSDEKDILYNFNSHKRKIKHPEDPKRRKSQPCVFIGPIASANILQKDPKARDILREKFGVKAIEMEASGIADATWNHEVGYMVVRGICDYCDPHKNDVWQQYAAVVAAAYTRALIESMP